MNNLPIHIRVYMYCRKDKETEHHLIGTVRTYGPLTDQSEKENLLLLSLNISQKKLLDCLFSTNLPGSFATICFNVPSR